jgi:Tfp pilus assembly protein PilO
MLGLLFSAWYFVFKQADDRIAELRVDTEAKRRKLDELAQATKRIADINAKIADLQKQIHFFESRLPRQSETPSIVAKIDEQARSRRQLTVGSVAALKPDKAAGYFEKPVKITMQGDFRSFYEFILQIERLPRITRVNQMHLTKIAEQDGSMMADMTLSIYFAPDSPTVQ